MAHTAKEAELNAFVGGRVRSSRKPVEVLPNTSSCARMPTSSKRNPFAAPRETGDVDIQVVGAPLQSVNFRKHANMISAAYRLSKSSPIKQHLCAVCKKEEPLVDLDATTDWAHCKACQRQIRFQCLNHMNQ